MNNMAKQMEMFDEGGLMDEGGTVDPVSGNDVPPGSTQEEVRDDIPAQLSEGEFVFPADVVRYFGLEKLMEMRQEAKAGLARMEAMGQMGNSEEATLPDDIPFSIEDLDTEDEGEYNTPQEFAYGGVVKMSGTNYNTTPNPGPTTGFRPYVAPPIPDYTVQPVQQGPQFQGSQLPGTQFIGATQTTNIPTFGQTVGNNPGQYDEFRTYVNSSGQTLQIPFKNGQPLYPIPEGYTLQQDNAIQTTSPRSTVGPTDFESEEGDGPDYGGGTSLITGEKIAGYSPEEIKTGVTSAKDRYAITGNRGFDLLNVLPGGTFIKNLLPDTALNIFGTEPTYTGRPDDSLMDAQQTARNQLENSLGVSITGYVGFQKGDLDPNSGGFFDKNGIAVDGKTGDQSKNETGTFNYASFSDYKEALSAGNKSGWRGGKLGAESYSGLSSAAKNKYDKFADILGYTDHKEVEKQTETEKALGYAEGVTQREFDKETASEAAAREAANKAQADRQAAARAARDALDRARENDEGGQDTGVGESDGGGYGSDAGTGGGGDMGVICLTEDMKVKRNGVIDFVTNVQVGDIVDYTRVTEVLHKHMREGYYVVNGELKITNDHPVLANGSWKRTENLVLGDYINNVEVTSLEYIEQVTPTVYIGTADDRYDVYTEGEVYTVHGQYKNALKKAA